MKYRYVDVNCKLPSARFIAKQYKDYSCEPYRADWKEAYEPLVQDEIWEERSIGDRYGRWREE